jgi:putative transposase
MAKISVFSQIIKLIPRSQFEEAVAKYNGDKRTRSLNCWTWFGSLIFSQLSGHDSIRALERVFEASNSETSRLGFNSICRSTLSDANARRPVEILEEIFSHSLKLATKARGHRLDFGFPVYLLDSTFIELCLSFCPWAFFRTTSKTTNSTKYAGVKLHTAIDLTGHLPEFLVIKEGQEKDNRDLKVARDHFQFQPGSLVVFDRGYWSADYFNELNQANVSFVSRMRSNIRFCVEKSNEVDRTQGLICDQYIYLSGSKTKGLYEGKLRRISYRDPETNKKLTFVTNRFDLPAKTICDLYKARWQVELFFKTLKQNLKIKKFLGLSRNAVIAQIYAALICYILLMYLKLTARSNISMPELMAVVGTLLLLKLNIIELIQNKPFTTRHPPPQQLSLLL